jgi:3-hydroxyisobutyryl-CoA hydrolase
MRFTTKILPSRSSNLGILTLNHPKSLHALTMDMIHCLQDVFGQWDNDPSLKAILIKSSEAKRPSFCAGGDVKFVYQNVLSNSNPQDFFFQEYQVNHAIATSKLPIVSLWDGVVMGGGVGLSVHGKYRVATENTLFAMPETAIGLFPDVGSMWWMPRLLNKSVANYLALSGQRLSAADLMYTGLATHYIPSKQLPDLETALVEATEKDDGEVASVLMSFHETIPLNDCYLAQHKQVIEQTFDEDTVEGILSNLENDGSYFGTKTLDTLRKMSPTSMKVSLEGLKRGAACKTVGEDLQMEFRMAQACCSRPGSDFCEGVRAVLVDKDHSPKWNPPTVEEVTEAIVEEFFAPVDNEWPIPRSKL